MATGIGHVSRLCRPESSIAMSETERGFDGHQRKCGHELRGGAERSEAPRNAASERSDEGWVCRHEHRTTR